MADGRHFKNVSLYLSQESSIFNEIWCADANFGANLVPAAILKIVCLGISQRFIVQLTRNLVRRSKITLDTGYVTKMPNFENSRRRTAAILKMV